jgi:diphthine-ammonia ligase
MRCGSTVHATPGRPEGLRYETSRTDSSAAQPFRAANTTPGRPEGLRYERPRAAISWSGGKDSCAALARARGDYEIVSMITMCDESAARSRSHGLRPEILDAQADRLGLRRIIGRCTWQTYDDAFGRALAEARADGITHVIFGDILFDEHRRWAEARCAPHQLTAVEPLFGSSTTTLFEEWTAGGADAVIVTARCEQLDASWLGRSLERGMLDEFARLGVDPCGERGEYHTVVVDTPLFDRPLKVASGERVQRGDCWALDLAVAV